MKKENKTEVKIVTVPNGYTLDIHKGGTDHGYLYFTLPQLLEGFIYHIGMEEMEAITSVEMRDLIEASMTWRDKKENILTILHLETENQAMRHSIAAMCDKIDTQKHLLSQLREKNTILREAVKKYEEVCANNGIKVEMDTAKPKASKQ